VGGELRKLTAAGANWLLLDEPTNHLELPAIEQRETALPTTARCCSSRTTATCSTPSRMDRTIALCAAGSTAPPRVR
jgi:hypothetical protein